MATASANKFSFQAKKISAVVTPYKSLDFYLFFHFFSSDFYFKSRELFLLKRAELIN